MLPNTPTLTLPPPSKLINKSAFHLSYKNLICLIDYLYHPREDSKPSTSFASYTKMISNPKDRVLKFKKNLLHTVSTHKSLKDWLVTVSDEH